MAPKDPRADSSDLSRLQHSAREIDRWQSAQQHTLSGRHLHAIAAYQELLRRFPGVAQLLFELAIAAAGELDFTLAADALRSAAKIAKDDVTLLILIGQQFHRLRRLDEARECFQGAVAADPSSVSARVSLADWYERERRVDLSSATIEACRAAHPRD